MTTPTPDADLRRAFVFLVPYWRRLVLVMAISLLSTGLSLVSPYLSKDLVDRALLGRDLNALWRTVGLFAALGVAGYVLNVVSGLRYTRVSAAILFDMRLTVYGHMQRLSPRFYARTRLGDIVSRLNSDIGEIQRVAAETALAWVGNVLFLVGCIVMIVWLDWRLALLTAAVMPLSLWTLVRYRRRLEARVADLRQRSADIGSFLIETIQASTLVVTSNAESRERGRFARLNDRFVEALMGMQRLTYLAGGLPGLIVSLGASVVFLYGGIRVIQGTLTLGTFAAFIAYQTRITAPVQALMGLYTSLATAKVSWRRVLELLDAPIDVREPADARALETVRGDVVLDGVSLTTERGVAVLEDVSLTIAPGQSVAIVGASGSGKSTLAHLLLRLLDPDHGVVRLDGHDLKTLRLADLRRHVVLVEQEPTLLHASVAENIRYARPDATDAEVAAAGDAAGLRPFVDRLPQGYATMVGERGQQVSVGERQRIALARAFLANPSVLVLDEPTAALDPASERVVVDGYRAVMRGRTSIVISHRAAVAAAADRVAVLEGARLVESGSPATLAAAGGAYARLFGTPAVAVIHPLDGFGPGTIGVTDYPGITGLGVRVAVIDSGVHPAHPHVGAAEPGVSFDATGAAGVEAVDRLGHGTAVAAAIREKAPEATLIPIKVFDRELRATADALDAAIGWAIDHRAHVINLSLGTANSAHRRRLGEALVAAARAGVCLVAADAQDGTAWLPGSLPLAVGVTLDWTCPREQVVVDVADEGAVRRVRIRASGYPRPIPGVPAERNLKGISFAVANASGVIALHLARSLRP